jgi:cytochrome b561
MKDTQAKFSKITVSLHWLVAILFIGLMAIGLYMTEFKDYALFPIHKSFGFILLLIALLRVIWRYMNGWPKPAGKYTSVEHLLAKVMHWTLIIGMLLMPISGMVMTLSEGRGLYVFGLELVASFPDPENARRMLVQNEFLAGVGESIHGIGANVMIFAIGLHLVGALKHHIIDKDGTLRRMLGQSI